MTLLHFGRTLHDLQIGSHQRAHTDGYPLMLLLQQSGPLLQPPARPKPLMESLEGPGAGSTP
jgi:hypothetical protein